MKTQKQLIDEHREQLDAKFQREFPDGRFSLQRRFADGKNDFWHHDYDFWGLHWVNRRPTSHASPRGISTEMPPNGASPDKCKVIDQRAYRGSSFGKCSNYDTLDKLCAAAHRMNCPVELIAEFVARYKNKSQEGFK